MFRRIRQAPPELFFYFILPLIGLICITIYNPYFLDQPPGDRQLITAILRDQFFSLATIPLFITYAAFRFFVSLYRYLSLRLDAKLSAKPAGESAPESVAETGAAIGAEVSSSFFLSIGFLFCWFVGGLVIVSLETAASRAATIENGFYLMGLDYDIFKTYPPFVIQQYFHPFLEKLTIDSYRELPSVIVLVFFVTLFKSGVVFRKYLLNLPVVLLPGFVLWYLLPALSPEEMFRRNILSVPLSRLDKPEILNHLYLSEPLAQFLGRIADKWSNLEIGRLAITSIPSMHLAWGLIVCYYAVRAAPKSVWFFGPYCFFNSLGTVYTLQHFVVDLIPGVLVGALSILFVEKIVNWDLSRGYPRAAYFSFIEAVRSDFRKLFQRFKRRTADPSPLKNLQKK